MNETLLCADKVFRSVVLRGRHPPLRDVCNRLSTVFIHLRTFFRSFLGQKESSLVVLSATALFSYADAQTSYPVDLDDVAREAPSAWILDPKVKFVASRIDIKFVSEPKYNKVRDPELEELMAVLHNPAPWLCSQNSTVTNLHEAAAAAVRRLAIQSRRSVSEFLVPLQTGAAESALTKALIERTPEAFGTVALKYRFTPPGTRAAILAATTLRKRGQFAAAALFWNGYFKDHIEMMCLEPRTRQLVPVALNTYSRAGFVSEYSSLQTWLAKCNNLSGIELALLETKLVAPLNHVFLREWSDTFSDPPLTSRPIPIALKQALVYGTNAKEAAALFAELHPNNLCAHLAPQNSLYEFFRQEGDLGRPEFARYHVPQVYGKALFDGDTSVRDRAAMRLSELGANGVLPTLIAMRTGDQEVQSLARFALHEIGVKGVPALISALSDRSSKVRYYAAKTLSKLGKEANCAGSALIQALSDRSPEVRLQAAIALEEIEERSDAAVSALASVLRTDRSLEIRLQIISTLRRIGKKSIPALHSALLDPDSEVRLKAASWLVYIGGGTEAVFAELVSLFGSERSPGSRLRAVSALGWFGEKALAVLIVALSDSDPEVRYAAASAIGYIGNKAESAIPALEAVVRTETCRNVVLEELRALFKIGDKAIPVIIGALSDANWETRYAALLCLEDLKGRAEAAIPKLSEMLASESSKTIRAKVAEVLGEMGDQAVSPLIEALSDEYLVQKAAEKSLTRMGHDVVPVLNSAIETGKIKKEELPVARRILDEIVKSKN